MQRSSRATLDGAMADGTSTTFATHPEACNRHPGREEPAIPFDREFRWFHSHTAVLREQYAGKWLALVGEDIVAVAPNLAELRRECDRAQIDHPFIGLVSTGQRNQFHPWRRDAGVSAVRTIDPTWTADYEATHSADTPARVAALVRRLSSSPGREPGATDPVIWRTPKATHTDDVHRARPWNKFPTPPTTEESRDE